FNHQYFQPCALRSAAVKPLGCLLKIRGFRRRNVEEPLGIAIDDRKPRALDLDHDPVAGAEGMKYIGHGELDFCRSPGLERLGTQQTVAEFAAEWFASD